jgi:hypothetical protein
MNDYDQDARRPSPRTPRTIANSRRILDSAWGAIAASGLILLVTALAALAGSTTMP